MDEAWQEEQDGKEQMRKALGSLADEDKAAEDPLAFYEEEYFDSEDEDQQGAPDAKKTRRKIPTNDELLYDDEEDDMNEDWVSSNFLPHARKQRRETDAVLSCPGCFTTLCYDCQQHALYPNQFRAMFVTNCKVELGETLTYIPKQSQNRGKKAGKKGGKQRKNQPDGEEQEPAQEQQPEPEVAEIYHPVRCALCNTQVAVYDKDEVYHFFEVIAGH